jgi:hypothetical protein
MLNDMPAFNKGSVKSPDVNGLPWSLLNISGVPRLSAFSNANTENLPLTLLKVPNLIYTCYANPSLPLNKPIPDAF